MGHPARVGSAAAPVRGVEPATDLLGLFREYVRMNRAWAVRMRSLLDEHQALDAVQQSLLEAVMSPETVPADGGGVPARDLKSHVEAYERVLILRALAHAGGIQKLAAESLGVRCTTLNEKIKRLGIQHAAADDRSRGSHEGPRPARAGRMNAH